MIPRLSLLLVAVSSVKSFSLQGVTPLAVNPSRHTSERTVPSRCWPRLYVSASSSSASEEPPSPPSGNNNNSKEDSIRRGLKRLAELTLEDYEWRRSVFQEKEADRRVEESLARMLGEDASYVRPMDASDTKIGPLGRAEKAAVEWLSQVMDEEGRRAKKIVSADGKLVRPIEAVDDIEELGPLGKLEQQFVEFLNSIRSSEKERMAQGVWRPKDMDETTRGPLGQLELSVVSALQTIGESEKLRFQQQKLRGGEVVRPIDVPGPLGEFELAVAEIIQTERMRAKMGQSRDRIIRPKDAAVKGKLGEYESQAVEAVRQLTEEERERLRNIQRKLQDSRPMESDKNSILGIMESVLVGIFRAPSLLMGVVDRVKELLESEKLNDQDQAVLERRRQEGMTSKAEKDKMA